MGSQVLSSHGTTPSNKEKRSRKMGIRLIEELCRADPTQYARMADIQLDLANKAAAALL
jgi:hypothetical protein